MNQPPQRALARREAEAWKNDLETYERAHGAPPTARQIAGLWGCSEGAARHRARHVGFELTSMAKKVRVPQVDSAPPNGSGALFKDPAEDTVLAAARRLSEILNTVAAAAADFVSALEKQAGR